VRPVAVIGSVALDRVDGGPPRIGGAPFYAARALRILGPPARIATKCAERDRAQIVRRLAALGFPVAWRTSEHTPAFSFSYRDGVRTMTIDALGDPWTADDAVDWLDAAIARAEWVQVGALFRSEFSAATLAVLARHRRILFDGQGLVRPAREGPLELEGELDTDLLDHVTALKLAEEEAYALVGDIGEGALRSLGVAEVIVTFGERGSLVYAQRRLERVTAHAVAADPTGTGDAFGAAYVVARNSGHPPPAAARRATALVASMLSLRRR
jgi:sugar/nucleoside kinase (ribokinase family)